MKYLLNNSLRKSLLFQVAILVAVGLHIGGTNAAPVDVSPGEFLWPAAALVAGDTVRVAIYETVAPRDRQSQRQALSSRIEHSEITGNYEIRIDGTIYLPLVGIIRAAGFSPEALKPVLEAKAASLFEGMVEATVQLIRREPIYVTGSAPGGGVFDYRPGMTVLHAMILAGVTSPGSSNAEKLETLRVQEHVRKVDATLAKLLARREVLVAFRDGKDIRPSVSLISLVGLSRAEELLTAASHLVRFQADKEKGERDGIRETMAAIEKERDILVQSLSDANKALESASAFFKVASNAHSNGVISQNGFFSAQDQVSNAKARIHDIRATLARLEERKIDLRHKDASAVANAEITRQREIDELEVSIIEANITKNTITPWLGFVSTAVGAEPMEITTKILRRSPSGIVELEATELSLLVPGDIIRLIKSSPGALIQGIGRDQTSVIKRTSAAANGG